MSRVVGSGMRLCAAFALACLGAGCTGDTPLLSVENSGEAGGTTPTITITPSGVLPKVLVVKQGQRVLFVNSDSVAHEMASDLHPTHERWPAMNQVGYLAPGQSRETGNLNTVGVISYHDHLDAQNEGLLGSIQVTALD